MMNPNSNPKRPFPLYLVLVASMVLAGITIRFLQSAGTVSAQSGDLQIAASTYSNISGTRIDSCSLCHTSSIPGLNSYGSAYKANGRSASALRAIENQDSDGDGFSNLQEIRALTFPGNAADRPVAPTPTNTPFQPATPTSTRTPTRIPATATTAPTNTLAPTNPPATSTATRVITRTSTPTQVVVTTQPSSTVAPTSTESPTRLPSLTAAPSATATLAPSRTPTVNPTSRPSVVPTCVRPRGDDDDDDRYNYYFDDDDDDDDYIDDEDDDDDKDDVRRARPNCSRKPTRQPKK